MNQKARILPSKAQGVYLTIVFLSTITQIGKGDCIQCFQAQNQCTICYNSCQSNEFASCSNRQRALDQNDCLDQCCNIQNSNNYHFTQQTIKKCSYDQNNSKDKGQSIGYYVVLVIGSCAVGILLTVIIRQVYLRMKARGREQRRAIPQAFNHSIQQISPMHEDLSINNIQSIKDYPVNCEQIIRDETNTCCICLDGNVTAITKCGHVFHLDCLVSWGNRRNSCPLCNYKNIQDAKVYCKTCKMYRKTINIYFIKYEQMNNLKKNVFCQNCNK